MKNLQKDSRTAGQRMAAFVLAAIASLLIVSAATMPTAAWADTVVVTTASDVLDGTTTSITDLIASPGADGVISLREAIEAANNTAGVDIIEFDITTLFGAGNRLHQCDHYGCFGWFRRISLWVGHFR